MALFSRRAVGQQYETEAKHYLLGCGLAFIEQNFNTKVGEIDLIMRDKNTLVFVEVKYRKNQCHGHAAEMVTTAKMAKLMKTANLWLLKHGLSPYDTDFRFDVIAIHQDVHHIEWIKNAITQG
ncbi:YraN family protein [Vibrio anguillarum]|uniref:YraN family protein n=1 Tax=Vibrio anguillarum TaxID=55601 RepID=UPI001D17E1A4|nr:YraN family protein [Vibrio anguillarum]MCC4235969.1 YraN family protein [Vibrio anguillarum]